MAAYSASYYSEFGNYSDHRAGQRHEEGDPEEGWTKFVLDGKCPRNEGGMSMGLNCKGIGIIWPGYGKTNIIKKPTTEL